MKEDWDELCKKDFAFNGETYIVRALSDGAKCNVQVFKNGKKVNKDNYMGDLDKKDRLMDKAESDVRNNMNQI
ncbi:MAG: hypothetical protein K8I01_10700 [Candidatus Methylomirabilis sp.]|nr:hypothetical protein [Deltaproteobacteria bacterium]